MDLTTFIVCTLPSTARAYRTHLITEKAGENLEYCKQNGFYAAVLNWLQPQPQWSISTAIGLLFHRSVCITNATKTETSTFCNRSQAFTARCSAFSKPEKETARIQWPLIKLSSTSWKVRRPKFQGKDVVHAWEYFAHAMAFTREHLLGFETYPYGIIWNVPSATLAKKQLHLQ